MEEYGIRVLTRDGQYFGRLRHVAGDQQTGRAAGLVVARNGEEWLVPLEAVLRHDAKRVVLRGEEQDYADLAAFSGTGYRLLDREMEREETLRWMEELGVEDFEIGSNDVDEAQPGEQAVHTGAENAYRAPQTPNGQATGSIANSPTDKNEPNEEMAERTRSDMH